ncbi:MAG TPA: SDR family NAD(P)-dependent oxidoreductase [Steroidobacteraceae bacterium]|jgi:NAD(P)-dependent dehydrogenase (short-subunit alcohol dehydrogenase family)|nr:SDR family NAD(P)-dependent oxidoreductase [Steroidobacteraceae bacterium]
MDYQNRHVVITGGTGALGVAVVGALLEAGAVCHVPYRDEAEAKRFPHRDHRGVSLVELGDLADESGVAAFYGGLDTLWASIHIAGGFAFAPISQSDKPLLMTQLESNLISAYLCSRAAIGAFRRGSKGGRIVNIAARQGLESRLGASLTAYTVAKAGVVALTIALAEEVAKEGILVNAVAPSTMDTPANRASMPKADFNAWPKVEEVAATILFLASPQNQVTRGAIVPTYGKA